jgi:hypothetical protein
MRRRVLLAVTGATGSAANMLSTDREPSALIDFWMATTLPTLVDLFMRRSFIMHHCFAVVWRRSLELNPCRIKFIKNQGVALWQRRRRVRRRNRRARDLRLDREILIRQAAGPEFGRFRLCCSKKQTERTVADRQVSMLNKERPRGGAA